MNWHYFFNGQEVHDGIVQVQPTLREGGVIKYVPLIIGNGDVRETDPDNKKRLPRIVRRTIDEAANDIYSWAAANGYHLKQTD
ncbi:hypothetical protein J4233_00400 [Candidatus Pacearchaeota archaeon]|nr:hypothetical protein [Candidatus Pacearchaeota archaeon]